MMAAKVKTIKKRKRVLIVEDDSFLIKAYEIRFKNEAVDVDVAVNAEEALKYFKKTPPNAVLLDIMLPGMNGFELLEEMKKVDMWKDVPVIIVSNLSQDKDIELAKKLGAVNYIVKADVNVGVVVREVIGRMK